MFIALRRSVDPAGRFTYTCRHTTTLVGFKEGSPMAGSKKLPPLSDAQMEIMNVVWETDYMGDTRTLNVHIHSLRSRIEDEPSKPTYLRTVRGVGYRFDVHILDFSCSRICRPKGITQHCWLLKLFLRLFVTYP